MSESGAFNILVPTDFTEATEKALEQAEALAVAGAGKIDLLHVLTDKSNESYAKTKLDLIARQVSEKNLICNALIKSGSVLDTIANTAKEGKYDFVVAGTHGAQGIRQNLFGADILRLVRNSSCPAIVVQKETVIKPGFKKILLPVGSHLGYFELTKTTAHIAKAFDAEVSLFRIERGEEMPKTMVENLDFSKKHFDLNGVKWNEVVIEPSVYSFGYAKQTLLYASENGYDLIGIMPHSSAEHSYFANADKERVLTNEYAISVLCSHGA